MVACVGVIAANTLDIMGHNTFRNPGMCTVDSCECADGTEDAITLAYMYNDSGTVMVSVSDVATNGVM